MSALKENEASSWIEWISNFDKSYALFQTNYAGLLNSKNYVYSKHPELRKEYDELVRKGAQQDITIQKLKTLRETVKKWLDGLGGIYQRAVDTTSDWMTRISNVFNPTNLNGLGAVPIIIGVATASASLAAIGYWITDAYKFAQKINKMQELEAKGMSPSEAAKTVASLDNFSVGKIFGIPTWIILLGIGVLIVPVVLKKR